MEFKGTKGVWYVGQEAGIFCDTVKKRALKYGQTKEEGEIAQCWVDVYNGKIISDEEAEANAKLIAAAPELLTALQNVLNIHNNHVSAVGKGLFNADRINEIEQVIKKAIH